MPDPFIALDANRELITAEAAEYAAMSAQNSDVRGIAKKRTEYASSTPGGFGADDITSVKIAEGRFMDLAIHKDSFLNDIAVRGTADAATPMAWKTRYNPVAGITLGGLFGSGPAHLYQTQDNYQWLRPYTIDVDELMVPCVAETQDPEKLGQRQAAQMRIAEAIKLQEDTFLANVITGQPIGTSLAASFYNYATQTANPYNGKTVYVVDPGVQTGTFDTSNIINVASEGGLTQNALFSLITQVILSNRKVRTIHVPKRGLPWRELFKQATIVANASVFGPGQRTNPNLNSIPAGNQEELWKLSQTSALDEAGMVLNLFGETFVIKANNALPKGVAVVTTDEPGCLWYDITGVGHSFDKDIVDERNPAFVSSIAKRTFAMAQPDPWVRNWFCLVFDTPAN
jgi:hypothetical protein